MKIYRILTVIVVSALVFLVSCGEFGDMNENPNAPVSIENNPELLMTAIGKQPINSLVNSTWEAYNLMGQYAARIVFTAFDQFEWGSNSGQWSNLYSNIRNCNNLYDIGHDGYKAVSLIMRSWMFQILTDLWGDIPYSEAIKAKSDKIYAPKYDTQEKIYEGIIADLEEANNLLAGNPPAIKGDILNDNDLDLWRRFANSLRLRVLMRLSNVKPSVAQQGIAAIVNNPAKYPILEGNDHNITLTYLASMPNCHPRSACSGYRVGSFNEFRMSETIEGVLKRYDDPRIETWFSPTSNSVAEGNPEWVGMANGLVDGKAYTYKGGDAFLSKFADFFFFDANTLEGMVMLYNEVCFILAEAGQRGWISDGQQWYEKGIQANFDYWGVEMPDDYLSRQGVAWTGDLEQIITQKWLGSLYVDVQGFLDFKRTGMPTDIKPGEDAFLPVYPSRFVYPGEEQTLNGANRDEAIARQGPDDISTKVWWEGN